MIFSLVCVSKTSFGTTYFSYNLQGGPHTLFWNKRQIKDQWKNNLIKIDGQNTCFEIISYFVCYDISGYKIQINKKKKLIIFR